MIINDDLLEKAKEAGARVSEAEHETLLIRAEYHSLIRQLHAAGASLREIAQSLNLSHQRVQQMVNSAGGSWWQRLRSRSVKRDAVCSCCKRPPSQVSKLIAGPNVYVCDICVEKMSKGEPPFSAAGRSKCSFCGKKGNAENPIVKGGELLVCRACQTLCRQILDAGSTKPLP